MTVTLTSSKNRFHIDLLRDETVIISRRDNDPAAAKKAFMKLRRILKKMPMYEGDTIADLKRNRESRGRR